MADDIYTQIAEKIIESQEQIIGPVAVEQAQAVPNITVDWSAHKVTISGDEAKTIDKLVQKYTDLFGKVSVEVCKEAASKLSSQLTGEKLPKSLQ